MGVTPPRTSLVPLPTLSASIHAAASRQNPPSREALARIARAHTEPKPFPRPHPEAHIQKRPAANPHLKWSSQLTRMLPRLNARRHSDRTHWVCPRRRVCIARRSSNRVRQRVGGGKAVSAQVHARAANTAGTACCQHPSQKPQPLSILFPMPWPTTNAQSTRQLVAPPAAPAVPAVSLSFAPLPAQIHTSLGRRPSPSAPPSAPPTLAAQSRSGRDLVEISSGRDLVGVEVAPGSSGALERFLEERPTSWTFPLPLRRARRSSRTCRRGRRCCCARLSAE